MDEEQPKFAHWWAFPVSTITHRLDPGARALLEVVRDDPTIHKVVLTRSRRISISGENLVVLPLDSREGQSELARCREVLVDRTPRAAIDLPLPKASHHLLHLGSGLPISPGPLEVLHRGSRRFRELAADYRRLNAMVVAGPGDAMAKAAATPLNLHHLWPTGLPRHDLVTRGIDALPDDLRSSERELRDRLAGRRLVLLWTRPDRTSMTFTDQECHRLLAWCRDNDAVLGVRETAVDRPGSLTQVLGPHGAWGLSDRRVPDPSVVLRTADVVITDGADEAVDFLLTGRPLLALDPEVRRVHGDAVGHYGLDAVLPGPASRSVEELVEELDAGLEPPSAERTEAYRRAVALAFGHTDDQSGRRLAERIRRQYVDG
jgi:hypothetical protein